MALEVIAAIVRKLFAGEAEFTYNAEQVHPSERFLTIPGKAGLRWIIPVEPKWGWPVLRQWSPYDISSRLKWKGLMTAYRTGSLARVPGVQRSGVAGAKGFSWERACCPVIVSFRWSNRIQQLVLNWR